MRYKAFKLEEYFAKYEFLAKYFLCCSDAESFTMSEVLKLADKEDQEMWDNLDLCYGETSGLFELRQAIADAFYPQLSADNILISAGTEDGIFCALNSLITPEDHVIVMTPCYQSLLDIPKMLTNHITEIMLDREWRIDIDNIQNALQFNTKCIVINFPHNPTGQVLEQSELNELVDLCNANKIWLVSDEVYRLLGIPANAWSNPVASEYKMGLSMSGMSKSFGMGGLRIGWIACQDQDLLQKIKNVKYYTSLSNNLPSQILALIAIKNKEILLARNNQIVVTNLSILDQFLHRHNFTWIRPQAGCVGFVKGEIDCEKLVKETGVLLMPGAIYDYPGYFRIGFGYKDMPECLDKLEKWLIKSGL